MGNFASGKTLAWFVQKVKGGEGESGRAREEEENFQQDGQTRPTIDRTMEPASASREGGGIMEGKGRDVCAWSRRRQHGQRPGLTGQFGLVAWAGMTGEKQSK